MPVPKDGGWHVEYRQDGRIITQESNDGIISPLYQTEEKRESERHDML